MQNCWREKPLVISVSKCYFLSRASEWWVAVKSERLCVSSSDPTSALFWPGPLPPLTGQLWQEAVGWVLQARFSGRRCSPALPFALHRSEVRARQRQGRASPWWAFLLHLQRSVLGANDRGPRRTLLLFFPQYLFEQLCKKKKSLHIFMIIVK